MDDLLMGVALHTDTSVFRVSQIKKWIKDHLKVYDGKIIVSYASSRNDTQYWILFTLNSHYLSRGLNAGWDLHKWVVTLQNVLDDELECQVKLPIEIRTGNTNGLQDAVREFHDREGGDSE